MVVVAAMIVAVVVSVVVSVVVVVIVAASAAVVVMMKPCLPHFPSAASRLPHFPSTAPAASDSAAASCAAMGLPCAPILQLLPRPFRQQKGVPPRSKRTILPPPEQEQAPNASRSTAAHVSGG